MIPTDVDMGSLESQLEEDGVAFADTAPVNTGIEASVLRALSSTDVSSLGSVGFVALAATPEQPADMRDIAHDLSSATGLDTVVVRTPDVAMAVSSKLTRAQVERAQVAMVKEKEYGASVTAFAQASRHETTPWVPLSMLLAVVVVLAFFSTFKRTAHGLYQARILD
ncbi:hypothetical protein CAPI_05480 [Corynebacterium capitovis DSM 44611]|uniref:Rv1476 family membrane protein n=1 Tax=Corynebacterium capitovis TaxID=131081 RepID=UPI0003676760|nr:DUF6676 family protein [Corynebacterium capitovis]WKD57647.1 hypothetical protein CAPI_05480 [Corynebacterium capitovis DSM 44611]